MFKSVFVGLAALVTVAAGAALFVTRDTAATHPTLQSSDLPPLIPTRAFYADANETWDYVVSGDARLMAYRKSSLLGRSVQIADVSTGKKLAEFPIGIQFVRWHPTEAKLRFIHEGNDWEADINAPDPENWQRITPLSLSGGWVKNEVAANEDMSILTWGREHKSDTGHMWRVSQDGREATKIAQGNSKTQYWVINENKEPILRADQNDTATVRLFRKTSDTWVKLIDVNVNDTLQFVSSVRTDGTVLARSSRGRDKIALVAFDTLTGNEEILVEYAETDVGLATFLANPWVPDVVRLGYDTLERVALTDRGQVFLDILSEFPQPVSLRQTYPSPSGRYVTQAIVAQGQAAKTLLMDLQEQTYTVLGDSNMNRYADALAEHEAIRFKARDGLDIPAILTMPKDVNGPIPFIVWIHGGPAGATHLDYGHGTQFLVNRGYGVLSVNFRGSIGFGKEFQAKGFHQYGRAMQDDVADAALWLVDQGLADTDALIAMGMSYGGYSAALAMTRDPGLFDAAIVEFPMLDVEFQTRFSPGSWRQSMDVWWRYFGRVDVPEDLADMQRYSPSERIDQIHGPIMVIGGMKDRVTSIDQVKAFEKDTRAAGKDVTVHYFNNAAHGARHWRDQLRLARLREEFLAKHAGGRSGGMEFAEHAPDFID